ncbi:ATP-binding protein [Clostridium ganghwense]|uniref:histidine kinase n=1 Tax=Clostridium ganghwense TaxID=312089 RepID=A0ABT4CPL9_9CLOT|nr:ATP-binding protein [Clostridium ganghwense]MCY6371000.1 ATP-binding protein [Clostridium ganghwense]
MKKKINLKLQTKITLLNVSLIFVSLVITMFFITRSKIANIKKEIEINIMNVAEIVAQSPLVVDSLENQSPGYEVQKYVQGILNSTKKIDIITVADMKSIRYAHPHTEKVGLEFVGGDEKKVIDTGERYVSVAVGTIGQQMRAFVPVIDKQGKQVGFVMASTLTESIEKEKWDATVTLLFLSLIGFVIGTIGAVILSENIKETLLGYEPEQITKLYLQKEEVLDAMAEGIIAIDENGNVTLFNNAAIQMLNIKNKHIIGRNIYNIVPNSRLPLIMKSDKSEYNKDMIINETLILSSRIPIKQNNKIIGAVAIFRDKTEVTRLAEELTGVKQIVEALRANTHEFMNKLHVILGLIQIEEPEEAKKYILNVTEEQQQKASLIMRKIEEPTIAALMLGKISRAKEAGINLYLDSKSCLKKISGRINSNALVTILGNLIENSIEAINLTEEGEKVIKVLMFETDDTITIRVEDTGGGIKESQLSKIFNKGFSTKGENRGTGLFLIKNIIDNLNGRIDIRTERGEGTKFIITIPKEEKND